MSRAVGSEKGRARPSMLLARVATREDIPSSSTGGATMTGDDGATLPDSRASGSWLKTGLIAAKVIITLACFALIARQVEMTTVQQILSELNVGWLILAIALIAVEIPLVGERWRLIVRSLGHGMYRVPAADLHAANGFGQFVSQVLPSLVGDGARAVLLRTHGVTLTHAAWSVLLDRAIGVYLLFFVALVAFLLPSSLESLSGYRQPILISASLITLGGTAALLLSGPVGRVIGSWPRLGWLGTALTEAHAVLFGRGALLFGITLLVHMLTVLGVFVLGLALGVSMPLTEAAVLMACMIAVTLLPISIGGWGVREVAVTALLTSHGASTEEAIVFSMAFGLVVMLATVPGAIHWLFRRNSLASEA